MPKKGYKQSAEHRIKLLGAKFKAGHKILGFKGKTHTEEFKTNTSIFMSKNNPMFNPETAKKISDSKRGELNPGWKGGISAKKNIRYNLKYKKWRLSVLERDEFTCMNCFTNKERGHKSYMTAHHIKQFAFYPELRYDLSNGVTLCPKCHSKETSKEMKENFKGKRKCITQS